MELQKTLNYFNELLKYYPTRNQFADLYQLFSLLDSYNYICIEELKDDRVRRILTDMLSSIDWEDGIATTKIENQTYFFKRSDCDINFSENIFLELCRFLKFKEENDIVTTTTTSTPNNPEECYGVSGPPPQYLDNSTKSENPKMDNQTLQQEEVPKKEERRKPLSLVEQVTQQMKEKAKQQELEEEREKAKKQQRLKEKQEESSSSKKRKRGELEVEDFETWKKNQQKKSNTSSSSTSSTTTKEKKEKKPKKYDSLKNELEKKYGNSFGFDKEKDMATAQQIDVNYDTGGIIKQGNSFGKAVSYDMKKKKLDDIYEKRKTSFK